MAILSLDLSLSKAGENRPIVEQWVIANDTLALKLLISERIFRADLVVISWRNDQSLSLLKLLPGW